MDRNSRDVNQDDGTLLRRLEDYALSFRGLDAAGLGKMEGRNFFIYTNK